MKGGQVLHIVEEFPDVTDSVWTCRDSAEARVKQLNEENGGDFASMSTFYANEPRGLVVNLDA